MDRVTIAVDSVINCFVDSLANWNDIFVHSSGMARPPVARAAATTHRTIGAARPGFQYLVRRGGAGGAASCAGGGELRLRHVDGNHRLARQRLLGPPLRDVHLRVAHLAVAADVVGTADRFHRRLIGADGGEVDAVEQADVPVAEGLLAAVPAGELAPPGA